MLSLLHCTLAFLAKCVLCLISFIVAVVIFMKLWLQPTKARCSCQTRLDGKVAVVTGGNSGIGLETARALAGRGARVVLACRSSERAAHAAGLLRDAGGPPVRCLSLDLSRFSSVRHFAARFHQEFDRLDILVNNAGCGGLEEVLTDDGNDVIIQTNYLGAFMLTNLLMDKLVASKPSRIVVVSSIAHRFSWFYPEDVAGHKVIGRWNKYCNSKLLQVLWTKALAMRLPAGVTVNAAHPGVVATNIWNNLHPFFKVPLLFLTKLLFKNSEEGAQCVLHLCLAPELADCSGGYYDECRLGRVSRLVLNKDLIENVWKESMRLTESN